MSGWQRCLSIALAAIGVLLHSFSIGQHSGHGRSGVSACEVHFGAGLVARFELGGIFSQLAVADRRQCELSTPSIDIAEHPALLAILGHWELAYRKLDRRAAFANPNGRGTAEFAAAAGLRIQDPAFRQCPLRQVILANTN